MENEKPIKVIFLKSAEEFIGKLDEKARNKLFKAMRKTQARIYGHWFKKLKGTNGIYEFRIDEGSKFYRLFAFWNKEGKTETLIIGTHGIAKKTNKTPVNEIQKAERLKQEYFDNK
ncbi:MAG: type II toxin-antitoxin system RelE/ParE family toxin [Bacteroidales bacterium]|jgi:phage-related protein|nr:type II toxin-antitoxin system RelE/ParE family toxin [Bacteroidales bacterium]